MPTDTDVPLCVNLDGTLLRTSLRLESAFLLLRSRPATALKRFARLFRGKASWRTITASPSEFNVAALPYHQPLLSRLVAEAKLGRPIVLVTSSHREFAEQIAAHLGIFSLVHAPKDDADSSTSATHDRLVELYGIGGFDYVGSRNADLPIWRSARSAWLVDASAGLTARVESGKVSWQNRSRAAYVTALIKEMRPHQWLKNTLVFVPMITAQKAGEPAAVLASLAAFLAFNLCASSVYALNDMVDLPADRQHPTKRKRPLASGTLPMSHGLILMGILLAVALWISLALLPLEFLKVLIAYYCATVVYSFWAKERVTFDVLFLAGLYTIRLLAGAAAIGVEVTFWLLAFSTFIFLSLAFIKRYTEMLAIKSRGALSALGRGYTTEDMPAIQSMGISAGYGAVLVLALYVNSEEIAARYAHPHFLWWLCPLLLFWISRVWIKTCRGEMPDDPIIFAARDRLSLIIGMLFTVALWLAGRP